MPFRWPPFRRGPESIPLTADLRKRIRGAFDDAASDEEHFPAAIDPRIYHVKLILDWLGAVGAGRVLDAGCGKGRFARVVAERNPRAEIWGLDISPAMLSFCPQGVRRCCGALTELPFASGAFDAAYATESLEHAVDIETAVAELCRVVRPGGRIAVIDKNAQHWGRMGTPDWERWFGRRQLEKLLAHDCREVSSRFISYWEDVPPDGLFIAWTATK
jgi:ubiquinone/menaquinone biosynthesis C-methylase UbiE